MLQNAISRRKSAPGLAALMNMSLVLRLPRKMHLCRSSWNVPRTPSFLEMLQDLTFYSLLARCRIPCPCQAKPHLNLVRACGVFNMLTLKCVKSGLNPSVFFHFWLRNALRATRAWDMWLVQTMESVDTLAIFRSLTWCTYMMHIYIYIYIFIHII